MPKSLALPALSTYPLQQDVATKQAKAELDKAFAEQEQLAASLTASHSRPHQVHSS